MMTLLSKDHPITEKAVMEFQPFGKDADGRTIHDLSGIVIKAAVEHLEDTISQQHGAEAGRRAIEELVRRLNGRIPDPAFHVTAEFLKNPWNGYSGEFSAFNGQLCLEMSGDRRFNFNMARHKAISHMIQVLGRPFSVQQIYKMSAYFSQRYGKDAFLVEAINVGQGRATLRMTFSERMCRQFGEYRRACGYLWCDAVKGYFTGVPERFHNLPPADVVDRRCIAEGDDYCEWDVTWSAQRQWWRLAGWVRREKAEESKAVPRPAPGGSGAMKKIAVPLARRVLRAEIEQREQLVEEQVRTLDSRHVELQEAYVQQQQTTAELKQRVDELTTLHETGLVFTSILEREALISNVLHTIVHRLRYDRAMISFFDPSRQVLYDARTLGFPPEIAQFARGMEIPVTDLDSIEGTVLLKGEPVLLRDVRAMWDRLHPLHRQLAEAVGAKSVISVPLKVKNEVLGCLIVDRAHEGGLTQDDLTLIGTLATQVAISLDNAQTYQQIEQLTQTLEQRVQERTQELQNANTRLQELDRLKSEFFANVSHEFRTPLTLSLGALKTLLKLSSTDQAKEQVHAGLRNTSRLLFLINELLDLAKCESGMAELKKRCIDMAALVRDAAANFESSERRRIHFRGMSEPVPVEADPHQIRKVLYNLLSNAFKFSDPDGGQVWIRLGPTADGIELEIEDNGIGIPRDQFDRIFDRFTQVEGSATRRYEGTGIGLALVKEIVTSHGGMITVESEIGRGSTFTIQLPRGSATSGTMVAIEGEDFPLLPVAPETQSERGRSDAASPSDTDYRPLLLVTDDNVDMRWYLGRLFSNHYRVVLAKDGVEGLEQAKACRPDLIVTDVMMPRMSGHDFLKAVREDNTLRSTPVIFLTARAGTEAQIECLEAGADDFVAKPFDENEILARVNNLIRMRAQERELMKLQKEKLTRYMPQQLAEVILSDRDDVLKSHRAEITVVFIDLRGFTAFAETAEPEDVLGVLQEYQTEMGKLIAEHHGMIERFSGDALMIFFNDPVPVTDHAEQAVRLALAMRDRIGQLKEKWSERGIELGAGIGVATGFATLGMIGFETRKDYAAIGAVTNLAARLCVEARHGQILIPGSVLHLVKDLVRTEALGDLALKGFQKPVPAFNVIALEKQRPPDGRGDRKKKGAGH